MEDKEKSTDRAGPTPKEHSLTVMAVQEILGLFSQQVEPEEKQEKHEYLKKNPLSLI